MTFQIPTWLYRLYDADDRLLYVGITNSVGARMAAHAKTQTWWSDAQRLECEQLAPDDDAKLAEREAIAQGRPIHNRSMVGYIPTPTWAPGWWRRTGGYSRGSPSVAQRLRTQWTHFEREDRLAAAKAEEIAEARHIAILIGCVPPA